jgi:hypothetical protein
VPKEEPTLEVTHGCIRAFDQAVKDLKEITDRLETNDSEEEGGQVVIVDDLETIDGTLVPSSELVNDIGSR